MKKIVALLLALVMLLAMTACGKDEEGTPTGESTGATTNTENNTTGTEESVDNTEGTESTQGTEGTAGAETTAPPVGNTEMTNPTHTHAYVDKVIAATCNKEGYTLHTCSCGDSYSDNKSAATGHSFSDWEMTKEPTTTSTGSAERKCSKCNEKETKVLGQLIDNHQHSYTSKVTIQPTCKGDGQKTYSCTCGDSYTEAIASVDHQYSSKVTKATCTNEGYTTYTCTVCGNSYRDNFTHPNGHNWKAETCTTRKTCLTCGVTEGDVFGHSWKAATCTAPKTCKNCGATEGSTTAHNWKAATCTAPKTCKTCGATDGSAVGHSWSAATCTTPKTCKTCGATEGKANGHKWLDGKCEVCSTIRTEYTTEKFLDELEGVSFTYVGITYDPYGSSKGFSIWFQVVNSTDEMILVQSRNEKVNGHSCWTSMSNYIAPNTTQTVELHVAASDSTLSPTLNDYGEDMVEYVEFNFYVGFNDRENNKHFISNKDIFLYPYK